MSEINKQVLPRMTADAAPYWEGTRKGELRYQKCIDCGAVVWHPRYVCPYCLSLDLKWQKSSGKGKVYTFSTLYRAPYAALEDRLPYTVAIIELDEGFFMCSEVVDCDPSQLKIGMLVEVVFEKITEEVTLPKFKPM